MRAGKKRVKNYQMAAAWLLLFATSGLFAQTPAEAPIYLDAKRTIEERVDDLMSRMTLKEKVGQMNLPCIGGCGYVDIMGGRDASTWREAGRQFAAGTFNKDIGPGSGLFSFADQVVHDGNVRHTAEAFNELQKIAVTQTRLKIPLMQDEEGMHGASYPGATVFPEGLAIGSSFDVDLAQDMFGAAAAEGRAVGIHILSSLVTELNREPRMGRNQETYTEDPYLDMRIAEAIVRGMQGGNLAAPDKLIALQTDFPTESSPAGGLERGPVEVSERSLRENDLIPWAGSIRAGALGVMASYSEIEDLPSHASEKWMNDILRKELGFEGIVESEGGGFQTLLYEHIVSTQKEAGALGLKAGIDLNITYEPAYLGLLVENVEEGRVPMALVDRAVRRILKLKFRLGLFENPYVDVDRATLVVHSQQKQDLALRAGHEAIVLLKNEKSVLPLSKSLKNVAVIGPDADDVLNQLGDYTPSLVPQHVPSILEAIKTKLTPGAKVTAVKGCAVLGEDKSGFAEAIRAAKSAQVAIVVVGESMGQMDRTSAGDDKVYKTPPTDGEGYDIASLDLTGVQEDLIRAVYETGTPTVVVLVNGRPLSTRWTAENVPAILEAWRPGEQGGTAVADILFGDYNPTGRLPITIPRHVGQLPDYYNYKPSKEYWMDHAWTHVKGYVDMPATPLYPFGHGLSYSSYEYSNLRIAPMAIHTGGDATVRVDVKNTGQRDGVETVQLYLRETYAPVSLPVKQLRGFERVALKAGETKTVTLTLTPEDLQLLDIDMHWRVVPGDFQIMVGRSSADIPLQGVLSVVR